MKTPTLVGLGLDFIGVVLLAVYNEKIIGGATHADRDQLASRWWERLGYGLIAVGFAFQIVGTWWG